MLAMSGSSCCRIQRRDRTRSSRPLALAIIVPRAGKDVGNTALNVVVDIAKDEPPYVAAEIGSPGDEDMVGEYFSTLCAGRKFSHV